MFPNASAENKGLMDALETLHCIHNYNETDAATLSIVLWSSEEQLLMQY